MSFGFGVGDFLAVIKLANKIRKEFADAPSQFKDISDEVRSLSIILQDVEVTITEPDLNNEQKEELMEIANSCLNVLKKLEQTLDKYSELSSGSGSVRNTVKRMWKRLQWEPDDIKDLRSRLVANITLLNTFQGRITSQVSLATKKGVDLLHQRQDSRELREEYQSVLALTEKISPYPFDTIHDEIRKKRTTGTGHWFLNHNKFLQWRSEEDRNYQLWCRGMPGAGKTILTSLVIDHLEASGDRAAVAFFYCDYRKEAEYNTDYILKALLKQLVVRKAVEQRNQPAVVDTTLAKAGRNLTEEICRLCTEFLQVYIIIDALDEMNQHNLMRFLFPALTAFVAAGIKVFTTSRPHISGGNEHFVNALEIVVEAHKNDISVYIEKELNDAVAQDHDFAQLLDTDLRLDVIKELSKSTNGMFLLLHLQVMEIVSHTTKVDIRRALSDIPKTLDEAYEATICRVRRLPAPRANLALKVLELLCFSERPLSAGELGEALAIRHGERFLDVDAIPSNSIILKSCLGLLIPGDRDYSSPKFVHFTLKEYFKRSKKALFPMGEQNMFDICITYLSLDSTVLAPMQQELRQVRHRRVGDRERRFLDASKNNFLIFADSDSDSGFVMLNGGELLLIEDDPHFLLYAARFWLHHLQILRYNADAIARAADLLVSDRANKEYLDIHCFRPGEPYGIRSHNSSDCPRTPLAIAVAFQLDTLVTELAKRKKKTGEHFDDLSWELRLAKACVKKFANNKLADTSTRRGHLTLARRVLRQIEALEIVRRGERSTVKDNIFRATT